MNTKNPILTLFGRNIRTLREIKGFSQEELASRAGLDRTYIGGVERGERNIALLNISRIANALEVSVADFFVNLPAHAKDK